MLAVHDHTKAMGQQKVPVLCLDLPAAFDTTDHSILLHRLTSWIVITDPALSWIESYPISRYFEVTVVLILFLLSFLF